MPSLTAERAYFKDKSEELGYVSRPIDISKVDTDELFGQFHEFMDMCDEPGGERLIDALAYKPDHDPTAGGDYFVNRRRIGQINPTSLNPEPSTEDKDLAHIGPASLARAQDKLGGPLPKVMNSLLLNCIDVHEAAKKSARPYLRALGLEQVMFAENRYDDMHIVRLLHYLGTTATHTAELHFDRSAFTVALWESRPGLIGAPGNNAYRRSLDITELELAAERANQTPINHHRGHAKLFAGAGYNHLPDDIYGINGAFPLLLHGVVNIEPNVERDAIVVFMHPPAGLAGYTVPKSGNETGFDKVHQHLLNYHPVHEDVA